MTFYFVRNNANDAVASLLFDMICLALRNAEHVVRERFGLAVKRRVGELSIRRASSSPVSTLINNDVLKVCGFLYRLDRTPKAFENCRLFPSRVATVDYPY